MTFGRFLHSGSTITIISRFTFLPAFVLLASGLEAQVCSTTTTIGRYLVECSGYLTPGPNAPLVPAKILGTATADNTGTFNGSATASIGGQIVPQTVMGTEQVHRDCTGVITYAQSLGGQPGPPLDITFVVSQQGNRIDGLVTDAGAVLSCVLTRISNVDSSARPASLARTNAADFIAPRFTGNLAPLHPKPEAVNTGSKAADPATESGQRKGSTSY